MKLIFQSTGTGFKVYDETRNLKGYINKKVLCTSQMEILDIHRVKLCSVSKQENAILIRSGTLSRSCNIIHRTDANDLSTQASLVRPPAVDHLTYETELGSILIRQHTDRTFTFYIADHTVGNAAHMTSIKKQVELYSPKYSPLLSMQLFCLCYLMLHDDDIEIV